MEGHIELLHLLEILALIAIYIIYHYYKEEIDTFFFRKHDEYCPPTTPPTNDNQIAETIMEETFNTIQLALDMIERIGSEAKFTEEDQILFEYQGVRFLMEAADDCMCVNLIWPWCRSFSKFDIDEFARVRQVVNKINMRGTESVFYSITDSDKVAVHIKENFLFVSQIPNLENDLKFLLNDFFRTARTLDIEIEKCRLQECGM